MKECYLEIWKDINGYDNYEISDFGRVRNKKTGYILKSKSPKQKYVQVLLSRNGESKSFLLHRLVAEAFVNNNNQSTCKFVDHIDNNTKNNKANNLEWVTNSTNKKRSIAKINKKLTNSQGEIIELLDDENNVIKEFSTRQECADYYKCGRESINVIVGNKTKNSTTEVFATIDMYTNGKFTKTFGPGKNCRCELAEYFKIPNDKRTSIITTLLNKRIPTSSKIPKSHTFEKLDDGRLLIRDDGIEFKCFNSIKEISEYYKIKSKGLMSNIVNKTVIRNGTKYVPIKYTFELKYNLPKLRLQEKEVLIDEVWKDVPGYEGYIISNYGKLYNVKSKKYLKGTNDGRYMRVQFFHKKHEAIHRLVALAFIENPEHKPYVNHKDSNTYNNSAMNLEWVTQSENMLHCVSKGRHVAKKICQYDKEDQLIKIWDSANQIEKQLNIGHESVINMCRGKFCRIKRSKLSQCGFTFKYLEV